MNVIEYFDQVKIINLPSRKDRRTETELEFKRYGFPINTDKVGFFAATAPDAPEGFPNPGVRGCFLSHMAVVSFAEVHGLRNVLILEDDIFFSKSIREQGIAAIEQLQYLDWDIAYFGHAIENNVAKPEWQETQEPMLLAHFYAINGRTLQRLRSCLNEILQRPAGHPDGGPMHYDGALNTFRMQNPDIRTYYFPVNLGYQRPSRTDLHSLRFFDKIAALTPLVSALRNVKKQYLRMVR